MEIVTAWGTAREALSERPGFAALKDAGAVWRREKRYQHVEDAARQFTCFEVSGPEEPASNTPAPVSQKIWQALADQDRMILRLQRDVGRQDIEEAAWLYQVHTDIPDDVAGEYNEWYDKEHLPRLVTVPGVLRARRYAAIGGEGPRYLTAYDLSDPDAFESPQGLVARKTPWTARMRSLFFNTRRNMCKLITAN
ncbi:MAG TPA: hypothetical protein VH105_23665 [Burkholderiales bacterium]|nr:hypothetical protein [Burkholderiales bacterium]